jgi:ferredoxin
MPDLGRCALCPRLCRPACPVATGTAREAAVPTMIATVLFDWQRGDWPAAVAAEAATLCTRCGACESHCHIEYPLPSLLAEARAMLLPTPPMEPLQPIQGTGRYAVVVRDDRPVARALARTLGEPVRTWLTGDDLGVACIEHSAWASRARALVEHAKGVTVIVVDGGAAEALASAGVQTVWLHELVPAIGRGFSSCQSPGDEQPLACCGGAPPLSTHHPEDAKRVAAMWLQRGGDQRTVCDARCRDHLRNLDNTVTDAVDRLIAMEGA